MAPLEDNAHSYGDDHEENAGPDAPDEAERDVDRPRRSKRKIHVFEGMTDAERAELRKSQRRLHDRIVQDNRSDGETDHMQFLAHARKENNDLFDNVRYTREAVLDAENVDLITSKYVHEVEQMVQVPRYDAVRLVNRLSSKCKSGGVFDWKSFGQECGVCYNSLPDNVSFLAGALDDAMQSRRKVVRQPRRRADANNEREVRPEQVEQSGRSSADATKLSAAEKTLKVMRKKLLERCSKTFSGNLTKVQETGGDMDHLQEHGSEVDGIRFLFNPNSFTQTVENIFHFSFLIKKGEAEIAVRNRMPLADHDGNGSNEGSFQPPLGLHVKACSEDDPDAPPAEPTQSVLRLTMKDWRDICEAYELDRGDMPHRNYESAHQPSQTECGAVAQSP